MTCRPVHKNKKRTFYTRDTVLPKKHPPVRMYVFVCECVKKEYGTGVYVESGTTKRKLKNRDAYTRGEFFINYGRIFLFLWRALQWTERYVLCASEFDISAAAEPFANVCICINIYTVLNHLSFALHTRRYNIYTTLFIFSFFFFTKLTDFMQIFPILMSLESTYYHV